MIFILLFLSVAAARPSAAILAETWSKHHGLIGQNMGQPMALTDTDFQVIAKGGVAKHRLRMEGPDAAIGIGWTPHNRKAVWIAIIDDIHNTMVSGLTEKRLGLRQDGAKLLYQRLGLPWPFTDRQWVIAIQNNPKIAASSSNNVWQRTWALDEEKHGVINNDNAMWVPLLNGGWIAVEAGGGTLLLYQAQATIGGAIPDELVTRWAMATMDEMLGNVFERAGEIPAHYSEHHRSINGGDGQPIVAPIAN